MNLVPSTLRRSRLLHSIYVVGLAQLVVAGIAIFVVHRVLKKAPWEHEPARARGLVLALGEMFERPDELRRAVARLNADHALELTFYDLSGALVASTEPPLAKLTDEQTTELGDAASLTVPSNGPPITAVAIHAGTGAMLGYGLTRMSYGPRGRSQPPTSGAAGPRRHGPPPLEISPTREPIGLAIALVAAAIIAFLFARSLVQPLARLAAAARAFGGGDLTARAHLQRRDEIGAVAQTFDEMADRVNLLLRTQREFLANVAHELRTPLARIRVALDIAAEGDAEASRQSLADITGDWVDLDRLVESLLSIARLDLARDPSLPAAALRREDLPAAELVTRAVATFRAIYPAREVVVTVPEEPIVLHADGGLLRRVLDNLLGNAAKYSEDDTRIELSVRAAGKGVAFTVTDHGMGIDDADQPRLFEPFFRGDRSRVRRTGGVGLGLALAKRIVEAHGGRIALSSKVGEGTSVTFTIPA